ncbi:MAG TPA: PP2C family serine/threonine-protein phosphatase [Acidimicrobiales bacterium]
MTTVRAAVATHVGQRRQNNEDSALAHERLFAVADGMGGYHGGEIASATAIEALRNHFSPSPTLDRLEAAVLEAGRAVQERALADSDLRQMGTTLSAVALVDSPDGDVFAIAHIGDSRIYLLRDGELSQLTDDHTVPEDLKRAGQLSEAEAAVDPRRHIITRVLGATGDHAPDMQTLVPYAGDRLLLCSDGLTDELNDNQIASAMRGIAGAEETARRLVDMANEKGGRDNITVVVVDVVDDDDRASTASAALHAADDPRTSTYGEAAAAGATPQTTGTRRRLMTAEERNAQLRGLSREGEHEGPAPWETPSGRGFADEPDLPTRRLTLRVAAFLVVLLLVVGGSAGAVAWYARNSWFVGSHEGRVTIFKGRPGGLLWFDPTVEEETDLTVAAVPVARLDAVEDGHEVASLDEARAYVRNLRRDSQLTSPASPTTTTTDPSATTTSSP